MEYFFSFSSGKFIYGCNIISLIHLIKSKSVKNPYNRENISQEVIKNIVQLYRIVNIIFGLPEDAPSINEVIEKARIVGRIQDNFLNGLIEERRRYLTDLRRKPVLQRIQTLFMEMDQLGNYTHAIWFTSLERRDYVRLFRMMYDIWMFRGQLSRETRLCICILGDPFYEVHRERIQLHEASVEILRDTCLQVMENMVNGGIDDEYKKIGALHVLTALTTVSTSARLALPWLYESLY